MSIVFEIEQRRSIASLTFLFKVLNSQGVETLRSCNFFKLNTPPRTLGKFILFYLMSHIATSGKNNCVDCIHKLPNSVYLALDFFGHHRLEVVTKVNT